MSNDLRELHRAALAAADARVAMVSPDDLGRASPCVGWTLGDLLAHMIGQHLGFAAAAEFGTAPVEAYGHVPFTPEHWRDSITRLVTAFAAADLDRPTVAIELAPTPMPMRRLVQAQLLDTVIHAWDVARGLGGDYVPDEPLLSVTAELAAAIPDAAFGVDAAFATRRPTTGDTWTDTLARVGRDIRWQP